MYFRRQETLEQDIRNAYVTLKNFMQNREQVRIMDVVVVIVNMVSTGDVLLDTFKGGEISENNRRFTITIEFGSTSNRSC